MARILIVDDEQANLELTGALVQQEGYEIILASDGEGALKIVQESRPDVVLMDIVMPRMSGVEACRKIKTNPMSYATPVIMITALNTPEEKIKAIRAGADDFIGKPFDQMELSVRLKSLLRLKLVHDRMEASMASLREMHRQRDALMTHASKDFETPMKVIAECLQAVAAEKERLSPETGQRVEPALFCLDIASTMCMDFANIMKMDQDKLRQAFEALQAAEQQAG